MKNKAIEYLQAKGYKTDYDRNEPYQITQNGLLDFMVGFAEDVVNNLDIPVVSQRSELVCPNCDEECKPISLGWMCNKCHYDKLQQTSGQRITVCGVAFSAMTYDSVLPTGG